MTKQQEYNKEYYKRNKEKHLKKSKEKYSEDKEKHLERTKKYYENNKEKCLEKQKNYKDNNKEYYKELQKKYKLDHPNYNKEYYEKNKEKYSELMKRWYQKNKEEFNKKGNEYSKNRRKSDPMIKLIGYIRTRLWVALGSKRSKRTKDIFGCELNELKQHIESQFESWMNWENWGMGDGKWVVDHIKPISSAKSEEEVYRLNHYTNLRPLCWRKNLEKGAKV
jgi:hypothetical protein